MRLGDLITIRTGAVISRLQAKKIEGTKGVCVLTLKAQTAEGRINHESIETLNIDSGLKDDYITQDGDVLVRLTYPYTATVIDMRDRGLLVSSHFAIIRCGKNIEPWYLFWWINQNQSLLYKESSGSLQLGTISTSTISNLHFNPIDIEKQRLIAEITKLLLKERELLLRLSRQKEQFFTAILKGIS